jgi:hypothetical protein
MVACGVGEDEEPEAPATTAPRLVGRIASVHRSEGFALVENLGNLKLEQGLLLSTRGEERRTATLVVSGERLERFAAADIKSGDVSVGDAVYARPLLASAPSTDLETQRLEGEAARAAAVSSPPP